MEKREKRIIISSLLSVSILMGLASIYSILNKEDISLTVKGQEQKVSSFKKTVEELLDEQGVNYMSAGENIAYGQRTPEEVMNAWMNSQGHRENILNSRYTSIGVGCYQSSNGTLYWTQLFIS